MDFDDHSAQKLLMAGGYHMLNDGKWEWHHPDNKYPSPLEFEAANYLFDEWDWGYFTKEVLEST